MVKRKIRLCLKVQIDPSDYKALTWYSDATKLIQQLYGKHWQLFVDVLAATSPRQAVKRNWRQTVAIIAAYIDRANRPNRFADLLCGVMSSQLDNVIRALQGIPLSGPKVSRFAENLKGNLDTVTIDTWICRAYGIDSNKLSSSLYRRLERKIQTDAKKAGTTPADYQAVLWYAVRRQAFKRTKSFVSVYRSIFMETPCFAFMQEEN